MLSPRLVHYTYDERGRVVKTTYHDSTFTTQGYDGAGRVITRTDPAGKVMTYTYDAAGQLLAIANPMSQTTRYNYDAVGNLLVITDANAHQISFTYDALGRLTQKTWPDSSYEAYTYNTANNLSSQRLADGNVNNFTYNVLDQLNKATYFDGRVISYTYTLNGQPQLITDTRGVTQYIYDNLDRITRITQPNGQIITYTYDAEDNRRSLTTVAGTTTYGYDKANQLISVTVGASNVTFAYDGAGNRTQKAFPNGINVDYTYDHLNRLTNLVQRNGSTTLAAYTYTLGLAGNRLSVTETNGVAIQWGYDNAYRLTSEKQYSNSVAITQTTFTYDDAGNRLTMALNGVTTTYQYNNLDQLTSAGSVTYQYDGRGNLVQVTDGANITRYRFDAQDRLISAMLPSSVVITYTYDTDGRRVQETAAGLVINYLWDEISPYGDVVLETDGSGATIASYVLGDTELLAQTRGGTTSYYLHDGQRNVRALANAAGTVTDRYSYNAYGQLQTKQGTTINPYLYTGQRFEEQTGLYNLRARYYNPVEGRFLSRDKFGYVLCNPVELNRYQYVHNNPIDFSDPTGLISTVEYSALSIVAPIAASFAVGFGENLVIEYLRIHYGVCFADCATNSTVFGVGPALDVGLFSTMFGFIYKPPVAGSLPYTSLSSLAFGRLFPGKLEKRIYAPTVDSFLRAASARTTIVGRFWGRIVPILGVVAYGVHIGLYYNCIQRC